MPTSMPDLAASLAERFPRATELMLEAKNDAANTRLVGAVLLEQDEHWQLEGRRMFSAESMAAIPALDTLQPQASLQKAAASTPRHRGRK